MRRSTAIWWVRNEHRLDDNAALRAAATADCLVPLVLIDDTEAAPIAAGTPIDGTPRVGAARRRFLAETRRDLDAALRERGSRLLLATGDPAAVVGTLIAATRATALHTTWEPGTEEATRLAAVRREAALRGVEVTVHDDRCIVRRPPPPIHFTPWRHAVEAGWRDPMPTDAPERLPPLPDLAPVATGPSPFPFAEAIPADAWTPDPRGAFEWRAGEAAAAARIESWMHVDGALARYRETRNGLVGADFSSRLSPWLAVGAISPRRVLAHIRRFEARHGADENSYWLLFELLWRDYHMAIADHFGPSLFRITGPMGRAIRWDDDPARFLAWTRGETGEPFVDAAMRELAATGWLSNRARQVAADYLAKELRIRWDWGAWWFEANLIDYDPASNWGNWCYVAGVGTDPRRNRRFDPRAQAERYDPDGRYQQRWLT